MAWIPIAVLFSAAAAWGVARHMGLRSGGFMGAAFIAILLGDPWQVAVAACISAATYLLVKRLLMNSMILFGRRKFSAMLLVGVPVMEPAVAGGPTSSRSASRTTWTPARSH